MQSTDSCPECSGVVNTADFTRPIVPKVTFLRAGSLLWHVNSTNRDFGSPNYSSKHLSRFSPLFDDKEVLGTIYFGDSEETAIAETLWRGFPNFDGELLLPKYQNKQIGTLEVLKDLKLAELHDPGLRALRLSATQLTYTEPACYCKTQEFAQALIDDNQELDGFVWMSRQFNSKKSYLIICKDEHELPFQISTNERLDVEPQLSRLMEICQTANIKVYG